MIKVKNKTNKNSSNIREVDDINLTHQLAKSGLINRLGKYISSLIIDSHTFHHYVSFTHIIS
jgi:hypothetical protein